MMCSIPDRLGKNKIARRAMLRCALLGSVAGGLIGCTHTHNPPPSELNQAPLIIDSAMQQRDWNTSVAYFPNGGVPAWDTRFHLKPCPYEPAWVKPVSEPVAFLGQTLFLPVALVLAPPFVPVVYHGFQSPPTNTEFPAAPSAAPSGTGSSGPGSSGPINAYGGR
jgi:hypothetical protein